MTSATYHGLILAIDRAQDLPRQTNSAQAIGGLSARASQSEANSDNQLPNIGKSALLKSFRLRLVVSGNWSADRFGKFASEKTITKDARKNTLR